MRESRLLGIYTMHPEHLRHRSLRLAELHLAFRTLRRLKLRKDAARLLFSLDLAGEFCDVLAERSEPLILITDHFYESLSVRHQAILKGLLELTLDIVYLVVVRAKAGALGVRVNGDVVAGPRIPVQVWCQSGWREENLDIWVVVASERLIGIINLCQKI